MTTDDVKPGRPVSVLVFPKGDTTQVELWQC